MGIDANSARFVLSARAQGVRFRRTVTIGRQSLFITPRLMRQILSEFGVTPASGLLGELDEACASGGYAEPFLRLLGADEITSIDASGYEGASAIHDMNHPIPEALRCSFDAVIDGGCLEHVFNFPVAIKNCMEMVDIGGHFLAATPTN